VRPPTLSFNTSGSLTFADNCGNTITSPNGAWLTGGNTAPASNNLGHTGNAPLNFITNNHQPHERGSQWRYFCGGQQADFCAALFLQQLRQS
jgi:hypothetical protein